MDEADEGADLQQAGAFLFAVVIDGAWQGTLHSLQGTIGALQGSIGAVQGTIGMLQGTIEALQGSLH